MAKLAKLADQAPEGLPAYRLAVIGDCATQHISKAIKGTGVSRGVPIEILEQTVEEVLGNEGKRKMPPFPVDEAVVRRIAGI